MSLTSFPVMEQRSPEWYEARRGIVTASTVAQLITAKTVAVASNDYSRSLTAQLVAERITGRVEPTYQNNDMLRGILDEAVARQAYAEHHAPVDQCGFVIRAEHGWTLGWSPDGLVGDDGAIEVKCPRAKEHVRTILADEVPAQHVPQCQAALLVSGREWIDYVSFVGEMPLYVKRVEPDERWAAAIIKAVMQFEQTAEEMITDYRERVEGMPVAPASSYDLEMVV